MSDTKKQTPQIRRVVTGHDAAGKARVWLDGNLANHKFPDGHTSSSLVWITESTPADYTGDEDMGQRVLGTPPPPGGTRFCVIEIEPGNTFHRLHRTDTIDYVICLAGELTMLMDDARQVSLKPGEILVQRGTNHAWMNHGSETARFACVLVDGAPKRTGSLSGAGQAR